MAEVKEPKKEAIKTDKPVKEPAVKETPALKETAAVKTIEEQILDELKELNKNIKALFVSADDSRKILDDMHNERRP